MDKVVDPAGGSYYVEHLTVAIAEQAWKLFLSVEENGGFFAAVGEGSVQRAVNEACAKRHTDVARRKEVLLGTNQFPNINEKAADKIEISEAWSQRSLHEACRYRFRDTASCYRGSSKASESVYAHYRQPRHASGPCSVLHQFLRLCRL